MDKCDKIISSRAETFKKKSTITDKRALRAHRRSQEWKQLRQEKVNLQRNLEMSPLKEELSFNQERDDDNKNETKKLSSRRDALLKWKQEKELKKKLDRTQSKKPVFKVSLTVDSTIKKLPKVEAKIPVSSSKIAARPTTTRAVATPKPLTVGPTTRSKVQKQAVPSKPVTKPLTTTSKPKPAPAPATHGGRKTRSHSTQSIVSAPAPGRSVRNSTRSMSSTSDHDVPRAHGKLSTSKPKADKPTSRPVRTTRSTRSSKSSSSDKDSSSDPEIQTTDIQVFDTQDVDPTQPKTATCSQSDVVPVDVVQADVVPADVFPADVSADVDICEPTVEVKADEVTTPVVMAEDKHLHIDMNRVSCKRGTSFSFAPSDYSFKAPDNLTALSFQPLSPGSTSDFLFPGHSTFSSPVVYDGPFKVPTSSGRKKKTPGRKNYRNSLMLRTLSPEEKVEVILHSPMVETKRRTPKSSTGKAVKDPLPTFDDIDLQTMPKMDMEAMAEAEQDMDTSTTTSIKLTSSPVRLDSIEEEDDEARSACSEHSSTQNPGEEYMDLGDQTDDKPISLDNPDNVQMLVTEADTESEVFRESVAPVADVPEVVTHSPEDPITTDNTPQAADVETLTEAQADTVDQHTHSNSTGDEAEQNMVHSKSRDIETSQDMAAEDFQKTTENTLNTVENNVVDTQKPAEDTGQAPATDIPQQVCTPDEVPHDIPYFRNLIVSETARMNGICETWEEINSSEQITDDIRGQIRTTIGQTHLLMRQRFKQFSGLIDNSEFNTGEKEILCSDLQGFWDMIYFQVEDVDAKFENLTKLKNNNWVSDEPKVVKKKMIKKKPVGTKSAATKPVRSKFAAFRSKLKQQNVETDQSSTEVDLSSTKDSSNDPVPEQPEPTNEQSAMKTFDAGFFHINSPVSSPKFHCKAGTPIKSSGKRRINSSPLLKAVHRSSLNRSTGASPRLLPVLPLISRPKNSPLVCDFTPVKPTHTPAHEAQSPAQGSPVQAAQSPAQGVQSPAQGVQSPAQGVHSPVHTTAVTCADQENAMEQDQETAPSITCGSPAVIPAHNTPESTCQVQGVCTPARQADHKDIFNVLSPLIQSDVCTRSQADDDSMETEEDLCMPLTATTGLAQPPSLFTPEDTSTPSSRQTRRSARKSLRLTTLTNNSLNIANTSANRRSATDDDVFNKYLQPVCDSPSKENVMSPRRSSRRRSNSAPSQSTDFTPTKFSKLNLHNTTVTKQLPTSFLFTPLQKMTTPVRPVEEDDEPSPTINLMSFSPTVHLS